MKNIIYTLIGLFVLVGCGDSNDEPPFVVCPVEITGEWVSFEAVDGTLHMDESGQAWLFEPARGGAGICDLGSEVKVVYSIYNWRNDYKQYAGGCRITGEYRYSSFQDGVLYVSVKIATIADPNAPDVPVVPADDNSFVAGRMIINTTGGAAITSKEDYVECTVAIEHEVEDWNLKATSGGIRGRGNSTWLWYPKKPYRIKLDKKKPMLGLDEAKSWVLLAEYRDPTSLMNAFVFELGQLMGMPFTNHNRYVELVLNGSSQGLYHLTEQVQQNKYRVNIDEFGGYLIQLDKDDGPELSPNATDNFWSQRYRMPVCVKNPEELNTTILDEIKASLGQLEDAIHGGNISNVEKYLDVMTMIDFLIIQELIYNVELDAPRSMYMHHDVGGKWAMGPLWDFDAGFDFDWTNMTQSHNYFANYRELVLGTNPATYQGTQYRVPAFFSELFKISEFKSRYKARWQEVKPLVTEAMEVAKRYYSTNTELWDADITQWPVGKTPATEINRMSTWLKNRTGYLDSVIAGM